MPLHPHPGSRLVLFLLVLALVLSLASACRPSTDPEFKFILVSQELAVEQSRITFAILVRSNLPVEDAEVSVDFVAPGSDEATTRAPADYREIDLSTPPNADPEWYNPDVEVRGIYAIDDPPLDRPGDWQLTVSILQPQMESSAEIKVVVDVLAKSSTPSIGEKVSPIDHLTGMDVSELSEISTSPNPIPSMYGTSIADALKENRPFLVVFATPAFCQSRICGPVLETVAKLLPTYSDELEFIHIEPYDLGLIRGEGRLEPSREAQAWGLPSEPWVFLVDASGQLTTKFEGIVTYDELDEAVRETLARG